MSKRTPCRLRTLRRYWGLSQEELAYLLGLGTENTAQVSRIERELSTPNAETALSCELLFDSRYQDIFPEFFGVVEGELMRRAYELHQALQNDKRPISVRKREFLTACLKRAVKS
jgi:DNA-binding XRE family transcriptional regulator